MSWTALLPVKARGDRKTRLAGCLDVYARDALVELMLQRAIDALVASGRVARILVVSPDAAAARGVAWLADAGGGLNATLAAADAALGARPLLVLLPDLPLVEAADIAALLDAAAATGMAHAVDRHGRGTNAVALADRRDFRFRFGPDSRRSFARDAGGTAVAVRRHGLACDCDTPDDLDAIGHPGHLSAAWQGLLENRPVVQL